MNINPKLDLIINKVLDITPEQAWRGWTTPELFSKWFCPEPWKVTEARINLHPGGEFFTVMQSPEGQQFPNTGCILEVVPGKKLVWTSAMLPGFRPVAEPHMPFTAMIILEDLGKQTKYTALAIHRNEEDCKQHSDMGFEHGWSICADQLEKLMKNLA